MSIFYPGNVQRGERLQQLVDDSIETQTNIKDQSDQIDLINNSMSQSLNEFILKQGAESYDHLMQNLTSQLTPEQKETYDAMVAGNQSSSGVSSDLDIVFRVSTVIFCLSAIGKIAFDLTAFHRGVSITQVARTYLGGFRLLLQGEFVDGYRVLRDAGEGADQLIIDLTNSSRVARVLGTAAKFATVLMVLGAVLDVAVLIVQAREAEQQRDKLIDGIHQMQVARLSSRYFYTESVTLTQQLASMQTYMQELAKFGPDNPVIIDLGGEVAKGFSGYEDEEGTALVTVEGQWDSTDASRSSYRGDDIPDADVISQAILTTPPPGGLIAPGTYNIINAATGTYLDLSGGLANDGTPINGYHANGGKNQQWIVRVLSGTTYAIMNVQTSTYASHNQVIATTPYPTVQNNSDPDDWLFQSGTVDGAFYIVTAATDASFVNRVIDLSGASAADNTQVILQTFNSPPTLNQQWRFQPVN